MSKENGPLIITDEISISKNYDKLMNAYLEADVSMGEFLDIVEFLGAFEYALEFYTYVMKKAESDIFLQVNIEEENIKFLNDEPSDLLMRSLSNLFTKKNKEKLNDAVEIILKENIEINNQLAESDENYKKIEIKEDMQDEVDKFFDCYSQNFDDLFLDFIQNEL